MPKASVGVAIIAKNAAKTIGACLDSIVPHVRQVVVCVDENTTDATAKIARKHGAQVFTGLQVSVPHECPAHGRVMVQHFADARDWSFSKLRRDVDWWMWIDSDDVVKGGEKLVEALGALSPDVAGVWLPYHYSQVGNGGPTATLFDRERIVRATMPWKWQHRVHEVLVPADKPTESVNWVRTDDVAIYHQGEGHDTRGSAKRNILCLEIDLEENPRDTRALFYLGNQYFALNEWEAAIHYYAQSVDCGNAYQVWQTWLYLSMAYEKIGDVKASMESAYQAVDTAPYHPEPYYRLAALAMLTGDVQRCEFWTQFGDSLPDAPFFAFKNPLDRTFNARVTLAQAYANDGRFSRAKQQLELAARVMPEPTVLRGIKDYEQIEKETALADAFVQVMKETGRLPELPMDEKLWKFGRVRDVVVPHLLKARPNTQPGIIFWCGRSIEPWAPPSLNATGIGGSETAVIHIARRFANDGWQVDVFNEPDKYEGEYDGVGYWGLNRFGGDDGGGVFVSWRNPDALGLADKSRVSVLWCHDLNSGPGAAERMRGWDRILGVSQWHADYLSALYGVDAAHPDAYGFVPNGIELDRFATPIKKIPFRCVYGSSQDRGLVELLQLWPMIVAAEPTAELHVAYGWENFDKWIAMGNQHLAQLKAQILPLLNQKGVVWRGRLPQDELAKLYQESYVWLYPTAFTEVSCITAMEAMAAGCVPVTSAVGALPETIGEAGLVIDGNPYTTAWKEFWASCAKAALMSPEVRIPRMKAGIERAKGMTWDASYEGHWKPLIAGLLEGKEVTVCG